MYVIAINDLINGPNKFLFIHTYVSDFLKYDGNCRGVQFIGT